MTDYMIDRFKISKGNHQLELLEVLYESASDKLTKSAVNHINLSHTELSSRAVKLITTAMTKCRTLQLVDLANCQIDDDLFGSMLDCLKGYRIHVSQAFWN